MVSLVLLDFLRFCVPLTFQEDKMSLLSFRTMAFSIERKLETCIVYSQM